MKIQLAILACALGSHAFAQGHLYTPATGTNVEGPDSTFIFGWSPKQGQRFMDFSHVGKSRSIKGISFRLDGAKQTAIGRTWSNVKIKMAHGHWSSIQYNKSTAYKLADTPVTVFDKSWSFPALNGKPALSPATWGGVRSSLSFRFSKPWLYNGKDAIFFEFTFTGGKADGNKFWPDTGKEFEYRLDSMPQDAWRGAGKAVSHPGPKVARCADTAWTKFGKKIPSYLNAEVSGASTVTLDIAAYYTSPKDPVILALGVAGNTKGVDVGCACSLFYPDLNTPLAILVLPVPSKATSKARLTAPRLAAWKEFWMQAAWFDSSTRALRLTHALQVSATPGQVIPFATSYVAGGTKFNVWTSAAKGLPYVRYDV